MCVPVLPMKTLRCPSNHSDVLKMIAQAAVFILVIFDNDNNWLMVNCVTFQDKTQP